MTSSKMILGLSLLSVLAACAAPGGEEDEADYEPASGAVEEPHEIRSIESALEKNLVRSINRGEVSNYFGAGRIEFQLDNSEYAAGVEIYNKSGTTVEVRNFKLELFCSDARGNYVHKKPDFKVKGDGYWGWVLICEYGHFKSATASMLLVH